MTVYTKVKAMELEKKKRNTKYSKKTKVVGFDIRLNKKLQW